MSRYKITDLEHALADLDLKQGAITLIHSSLFALGRIEGAPPDQIPSLIYEAIKKALGPAGTIVVPTFNFDFCRGALFDRPNTPSKQMGSFSEFIRTQPDAHRSSHPMQSVAALGPLARELVTPDTPAAFEAGSTFDRLVVQEAQILLIGCGIEPVSLVHWAEERAQVPYRFWKDFTGPYRDDHDDQGQIRTYRLYARDLELNPRVHLKPIKTLLLERGQLKSAPLGAASIELCQARHFTAATMDLLREDPWALIEPTTPAKIRGASS